jgi:hypothetical protein
MNKFEQAIDPSTPSKALELLTTDEDDYVRRFVARNPNTPPKILKQLATDEDYDVHEEASQKHFLIMMQNIIR